MSSYDGLDLLADVFEDTENAPLPQERRSAVDGRVMALWPARDDPRWKWTPFGIKPAGGAR